ncbi:NAD(P)/FAD-dependent oxidoreductase [Microbacterium sp. NPDC096154]|uniref:flavin-containing monooxygenase n=1 Tax=Microbacterium sp. NPDC096154 TaxID=3155549 RepID=UPI00331A2ECA
MNANPTPLSEATRAPHGDLYWIEEYPAITETDDELRAYVAKAELPVLLASLAAALRDTSILEDAVRPPIPPMGPYLEPHGGMTPAQQERAREIGFAALTRLRDEGIRSVDTLPEGMADEILDWFTDGRTRDAGYAGQLKHELDIAPDKNGAADWRFEDLANGRPFEALIVGAGISGIAAAWRLQEAGIPFTWIEGSHTLGGTWWKNRYPGVRLDTPTYGYSFSFAQRTDWPHQFAEGHEVLEYLKDTFERAGWTDETVEFGTHLVKAVFDEESGTWAATTRTRDGQEQTRTFQAVITGVGQLDHPFIPEFPGQQTFTGVQMHSQEWDDSADLAGKRVAVIGTGASAYQIVPAIVDDVAQLYVFQRSAPWMLPAPTYHELMSDAARWLHAKVPHYGHWFRLWVTAGGIDGRLHIAKAEDGWEGVPHSVSRANEEFRQAVVERYKEQYEGRPDLLEVAIPTYPPSAKRMLRDNGVWARALKSPQTRVITSGLTSFEQDGVITGDGEKLDVDVVIYATGFRPSDYLDPIEIVGRGGVEIHDYWGGDAKGFAGITVPGFPNLFMLLGPNTGGVVGGALHFMIERAAEYAVKSIRELLERDAKALDLKQEALDRHIAWVDEENYRMTWGQPYVKTWYKNRFNRVSQVWPYRTSEYWRITEQVNPDDYEFLR